MRFPIVVADDFNGDGRADLAVFDGGVYVVAESVGVGNPPQLFLSSPDGRLRSSSALADAVRREHALRPNPDNSGPADLHLKSATSGDIDGDGDIDLWVDSIGGANVSSHFMVNNGDGTFTIDEERAPTALRYNPPEAWYHKEGHLVDLDNDGDLDLALAQNRGLQPTTFNQSSIVLINDGTGHYPVRIELPRPAFADGYTSVRGQTHFDVNGDGFQDLLLVHPRNDDGPPNVIPWTGRYVQVLVNRGGTSFADETAPRALSVTTLLADALAALHEAGYLHGDVKPSNIGFTSNGSPKLLDFGLARETNDADTQGGTLRYLSPEVLSGRPAEEADDVWSLCVVLHEMVAGEHPFAGGGIDEVAGRIRRQRLGRNVWPAVASESSSVVVAFTASMLTASRAVRPTTARRSPTRSPGFSHEAHKSPSCGRSVRFVLPRRLEQISGIVWRPPSLYRWKRRSGWPTPCRRLA